MRSTLVLTILTFAPLVARGHYHMLLLNTTFVKVELKGER